MAAVAAVEVYEDGKDSVHILPEPQSSTGTGGQSLEQSQSEAFNPETGEINWDCPCLGQMVQPPCGDRFKAAFSCFVYSTEEPKGLNCISEFREMQKCFQEHPDLYGEELAGSNADDDDNEDQNTTISTTNKSSTDTVSNASNSKELVGDIA